MQQYAAIPPPLIMPSVGNSVAPIYQVGRVPLVGRRRNREPARPSRRIARRIAVPRQLPLHSRSGVARRFKKGGVSATVTTRKRKRKKARTKLQKLSKTVKAMKRATPKWSKKTFYQHRFLTMRSPGYQPNRRGIFCIECLTTEDLEDAIKNLTKVDTSAVADYSTENTAVKLDRFYHLKIAAGSDANVTIKYAFFKCEDDDNETVLQSIREDLIDRGYTTPGITAKEVPDLSNVTASQRHNWIPQNMYGGVTSPMFFGIYGLYNVSRKWKQIGKVKTVTAGPGDTIDLYHSDKVTYKPEIVDQEAQTYHKKWDVQCVIEVIGALGHDSTSNGLMGFSSWQLDSSEMKKHVASYFNPKGLREVSYTDEVDDTNITTIISADNQVSGFNDGGVN